jgi:hypothetical protein
MVVGRVLRGSFVVGNMRKLGTWGCTGMGLVEEGGLMG